MQSAVVIPVYNHGRLVVPVVQQCLALGFPVIVVDDGSTDNIKKNLQAVVGQRGVTLLHHRANRGKGAALLTGFTAAFEDGYDYALTIDADGQHNPEDIGSLINKVKEGERTIVIGNRHGMEDKNVPWTSRFGRMFSNFWVWVSGGPWLSDTQSGFRLYPLPETLDLDIRARRYQFEVEILVQAKRSGIPIKEAPVSVVYQSKEQRVSHFRPWLDFWRNSTTFTRLIFSRFFS